MISDRAFISLYKGSFLGKKNGQYTITIEATEIVEGKEKQIVLTLKSDLIRCDAELIEFIEENNLQIGDNLWNKMMEYLQKQTK
jgi:hypothetical protein